MDILETLKQKREVHRRGSHPLASLSLNERYTYCFGLGIMAKGNMKTINELEAPYVKVCSAIGIDKDISEEMIVDINDHFEQSFDYLMQVLSIDKRISTCFMIDLLKLKSFADWGSYYCDEVTTQFKNVLKISDETMTFLDSFMDERKRGDSAVAHTLVDNYRRTGNEIDYELLYYMNEEYSEKKQYKELILDKGGTVRIESPTEVEGDIVVSNGTKLYITNTTLKIGGTIDVSSGRIEVVNSLVEAVGNKREKQYLLELDKVHDFKIKDSTFDMHYLCAGLRMKDGRYRADNSYFYRSAFDRMIDFSGESIELNECYFEECLEGAIMVTKRAKVEIFKTAFVRCVAEHGGALHSATTEKVHLRECEFKECTARFLGAAAYFQFKRYGQEILGCIFEKCEPDRDVTFNVYRRIDMEEK